MKYRVIIIQQNKEIGRSNVKAKSIEDALNQALDSEHLLINPRLPFCAYVYNFTFTYKFEMSLGETVNF